MSGNRIIRQYVVCIAAFLLSLLSTQASAIILGNTEVPRDSFLVFLCAGNSNMAGRVSDHDTGGIHPKLWKYNVDTAVEGSLHEWVPAQTPFCWDGPGGGPGMPLLRKMLQEYPEYYFGVMVHGKSGRFRYACRDAFQKGQDGYETVMTCAMREVGNVTYAAIITMIGDVETQNESYVSSWDHINNFAQDVSSMVSAMRQDLNLPDLPYLQTEIPYGDGTHDPTRDACIELRRQISLIPEMVSNAAIISSEGISLRDGNHYSYKGYLMWADRVSEVLRQNNWAPGQQVRVANSHPPSPLQFQTPSQGQRRLLIAGKRSDRSVITTMNSFKVNGSVYPRKADNQKYSAGIMLHTTITNTGSVPRQGEGN